MSHMVPGQRAHFFVNLAGNVFSDDKGQIYSLGAATAGPTGVATLTLPSLGGVASTDVGFFAVVEMPNGGLLIQPIRVRVP
jgi:hypothetical protein